MSRAQLCLWSASRFLPRVSGHHCSARGNRTVCLTGKPTRYPNLDISAAILFIEDSGTRVGPFHRASFLFLLQRQRRCSGPPCRSSLPKSVFLALPNVTWSVSLDCLTLKLLSMREMTSVAKQKPLTRASSGGYTDIRRGRLRCGASATQASGAVPGPLDNQGKEAGS